MNALLVVTSLIFFVASVNMHLWHRRKLKALTQSQNGAGSGNFSSELDALRAGTIGLGERLVKIERHQNALLQRLEQLETNSGGQGSYDQAIRLIKQGINKQDLIDTCELSEVEAGLLMVLHKNKENKSQFRH